MWVRKQWEKQAEIAREILETKGSKLSNRERKELNDIIMYVDELKKSPLKSVAVDFEERRHE